MFSILEDLRARCLRAGMSRQVLRVLGVEDAKNSRYFEGRDTWEGTRRLDERNGVMGHLGDGEEVI